MPVLPLVLGWLLLAAGPTPSGYVPTGSPVELYDLGRLALLRAPGARVLAFRLDPNAEFQAAAGKEGMVIAETDGPGVIQQLWFTHPIIEGETRLRIYLDGKPRPALDISLKDLFQGNHPHFPGPLVGDWAGGLVCYVPIAFREGCTITVDPKPSCLGQMDILKLPSAAGITTFTATPTAAEADALRLARALWLEPEALWSKEPSFSRQVEWKALSLRSKAHEAKYNVDAAARSSQVFALPTGPRTLRSLEVTPTPQTADAWRAARLRLVWEGDDPAEAGVDLPLGLLFGQVERTTPYRSLLVGQHEMLWYNSFPMPYRRQAMLRIDADEPLKGVVRVRSLPGVDAVAGYFHAQERRSPPEGRNADFEWLSASGRGHLAGVFVAAAGKGGQNHWLQSDPRLTLDGRPLLPGKGLATWFNRSPRDRISQPEWFPLSGFPVAHREGDAWRAAAYRWDLTDPLPFADSINMVLKREPVDSSAVDLRAVVFWYSERPGSAHPRRGKEGEGAGP